MADVFAHYVSLIHFAKTQATIIGGITGIVPAVFNIDAHAQIDKLPTVDIIGFNSFQGVDDDRTKSFHAGFGVMTFDDPDLTRHMQIVNVLMTALRPGVSIPLLEPDGHGGIKQYAYMVVERGTQLAEMQHTDIRSIQNVMAHFASGDVTSP